MNTSRRHFLRAATSMVAATGGAAAQRYSAPLAMSLAGMAALASQSSSAANVGGYRALVCLFMNGGNDAHNWVVPIDPTGYAEYAAVRRELAWPIAKLLPISSTSQAAGRSFGMPEELQPLRQWYEAGQAAVVANVGTLVRPVTLADFKVGVGLPRKLFSHNDQASTWQSLLPEGARSGWGGRMGDVLMSANQKPVYTAISTTGNAVFLSGNTVTQFQVGSDGPLSANALGSSLVLNSSTANNVLRRSLVNSGSTPLQAEYARVMQRAIDSETVLQTALKAVAPPAIPRTPIALGTDSITLDNEPLAKQLRMVAQLIGAGQTLGMRRQVFMVSMPGFDTHRSQMRVQPGLMASVAHSVNYFLSALDSLGQLNNVLLFSASDFGRTLTSNGEGSDHGWGAHHFVAGGALKGRNIYGRFPLTALGTENDVGSGRLLPNIGVSELAATMGSWMGLTQTELAYVLPGLPNFSNPNLGFV